jgi:hypothetical protein
MKKQKWLALITLFFATLGSFAQISTVQYTENTGAVLNPERGFYRHVTSHNDSVNVATPGNSYKPLTQNQLNGYKAGGSTLILRLFYIHEFAGADHISQTYLTNIAADFQMLRANGMKAIVRFAYSNSATDKDKNITLARIQQHLADLKPILAANQDVITAVQAGFIGAWGEWYFTDNFGDMGAITNQEWIKRYNVITALLQNVPSSIMVQLRSPQYKTRYLQYIGESTSALNQSEAYNTTLAKARLGYHNDCFLSTPDNKVKTITIPKSLLTNLSATITLGYRALKNFIPVNQAQLPVIGKPFIAYTLGSSTAVNGIVDWATTPNLTFPSGNIVEMKAADDATNIYIRVTESGYLDSDAYELFINKDNTSTTGWIDASAWTSSGADILLQNTILYNYSGANNAWGWTPTATGTTVVNTLSDAWDDRGTFTNLAEIEYVAADTQFLASGGESCSPNNQNQCIKSIARMQKHHYTYLNTDYHPDVISRWQSQSCYGDISKRLGYRLRLTEARIQNTVHAGKKLSVSIDITNDGFAAPYKARPLQLVLTDTVTNQEYKIDFVSSTADVRFWSTGNHTINESVAIPTTIAVGTYTLSLNLPDSGTAINTNPAFSIQLANQGIWDAATGYNHLNTTLNVLAETTSGTPAIVIDGNANDWQDVDNLSLGSANIQTLKSYDDATNLYFLAQGTLSNNYTLYIDADGKSYTGYKGTALGADYKVENGNIYRHEFDESWIQLTGTFESVHNSATTEIKIPKTFLYGLGETVNLSYTDVQNGTTQATLPVTGLHGYTLNFPVTVSRPAINIVTDGNSADWLYLDPVSSNNGELKLLKVYDDTSNIHLLVKGSIGNYQVFFNTDNNTNTGLIDNAIWSGMGADYAILGGIFYKHDATTTSGVNGFAWLNAGTISSQIDANNTTHEITISKSLFNNFPIGSTLSVGYRKLASNIEIAKVPAVGGMALYTIENPYIADLQSLTATDDNHKIHITVKGGKINTLYRLYIDTDNNPNTGNNDGNWTTMGAEYLVENGSLFTYNTTTSVWDFVTSNVQVTDDLTSPLKARNISIDKAFLPTFAVGSKIHFGYLNLTNNFAADGKFPQTGGLMPYTIQNIFIPDLTTITVSDDANAIKVIITGATITGTYEMFINTDNESNTGYADGTWATMGVDYMLQNGNFYKHNQPNSSWGWTPVTTTVTVTDSIISNTLSQRTITILKSAFTQLNNTIQIGYRNVVNGATSAKIPETALLDYTIAPTAQIIGEIGEIMASQANEYEWKTINLTETYTNPVVIFSPLSYEDNDPAAIRVKNVTATSFQYQIDEWDYLDEQHGQETFYYIVVEAGNYKLDGNVLLEAGTSNVADQWSDITFKSTFADAPLLFSQTVTYNDDEAVTTRIKAIDTQNFQLKVHSEEGNCGQGHALETVAWLAFSQGEGNAGRAYEIDGTEREYDHIFYEIYFNNTYVDPIVFANMQTSYGEDTCVLRYKDLFSDEISVKVEEERSADYEVVHTNEEVGFAVFEGTGAILGIPTQVTGTNSSSKEAEESTPQIEIVKSEVHVYPNPVHQGEQLKIKLAKELGFEQLTIYSSTGRLLLKKDTVKDLEIIDTQRWPDGLYFITLRKSSGENQQFKIINLR